MSPEEQPAGATTPAERPAAASWDRDGTDLARAFLARSQAGAARQARAGVPGASRSRAPFTRPRAGRGLAGERGGAWGGTGWGPADGTAWSGARGDDRDPQSLDATLARLVDDYGWAPDLRVHAVVARWSEIVGPTLAAHAEPEGFQPAEEGGVLTVRCDSTAWATQLRLLAPTLVRRLNEEVGDRSVARVVVLGPAAANWRHGARRVPGRGPRDTYG